MTDSPNRKRGRPPLPIDNETRERILNAAQRLFADRSFTQVSVREITDTAGVGIAAINYHFGSKDGLLRALFQRAAPTLLAERKQLLKVAKTLEGSTPKRVRAILHALLAPVIRWSSLEATQTNVPFLVRVQLDGPDEIRALGESETGHLKPFVRALHEALPELPMTEIYWRLQFVLGIEHSLHQEVKRLESLSSGACNLDEPDAVIERVLDFVLPGMLAPANSH
ncbi:MAG: TetR/AcrR family transcriptional regulator [Spongiibacteraceae bacterium]